jgi:type I restriction enzyme S subunit
MGIADEKNVLQGDILPDDWQIISIGEISQIYGRIGFRGYTKKDIVKEGQGAIAISPSNMFNGKIAFDKNTYISWYKYEESPEIKIYNGDILIVKTGSTFGKTALVENLQVKATLNPQIVVLKNITMNNIYLSYVIGFKHVQKQITSSIVGGAIPTLSQKQVIGYNIPNPPILEQTAIATALSNMDELILQTEKLIDKKKAIKQGVMQELLKPKEGWVNKMLGEVFEIEKGTQLNRSTLDSSSEFPVYNGGIAPSGFTSSFNTKENSIIISEGGNSCGFVNYVKTKFWRGGHCYEMRPKNILNKHFAYFILKYNEVDIMALRVGSGLPNIQRSNLAKYQIKFPDLNEQKLISEILNDSQESFDKLNIKLQKLKLKIES